MDEDLIPIVQKAYDFCVTLYAAINRFPRAQRAPCESARPASLITS